jgi:hypothetical protein
MENVQQGKEKGCWSFSNITERLLNVGSIKLLNTSEKYEGEWHCQEVCSLYSTKNGETKGYESI